MKDGEVLDGEWDLYQLDDMLAPRYQSIDRNQPTTYQVVSLVGDLFGSWYYE